MTCLPQPLRNALAQGDSNRSLVFDKTAEPRDGEWKLPFLRGFALAYTQHQDEYDRFLERRNEAFDRLGPRACSIQIESSSRLIVGHGLPHSAKIGFLFDRLRGVPYLSGSSLKGLLRETARLVTQGELPNDIVRELAANADEIFGTQSHRGALTCEDAYPSTWPTLEVDVLTPHQQSYYEKGTAPGDWESPVPVYFLTIAPKQMFRFWFAGRPGVVDLQAVQKLLALGLDWLGVGGKKSSGYGRFSKTVPRAVTTSTTAGPTPLPHPITAVWPNARMTYTSNDGVVTATFEDKKATGKPGKEALPDRFKKTKTGTATVTVESLGRSWVIKSFDWQA